MQWSGRELPVALYACIFTGAFSKIANCPRVLSRKYPKAFAPCCFYSLPYKKGWFIYHRSHYPSWSPDELVNRANRYAREFLLRGDSSGSDNLLGGRITLQRSYVKSWKLEAAVRSGALLVAWIEFNTSFHCWVLPQASDNRSKCGKHQCQCEYWKNPQMMPKHWLVPLYALEQPRM